MNNLYMVLNFVIISWVVFIFFDYNILNFDEKCLYCIKFCDYILNDI